MQSELDLQRADSKKDPNLRSIYLIRYPVRRLDSAVRSTILQVANGHAETPSSPPLSASGMGQLMATLDAGMPVEFCIWYSIVALVASVCIFYLCFGVPLLPDAE